MTVRDVVIPAGGTIDSAFARRIGTEYRALAPFGPDNVPALQLVINALRQSEAVGRIICIAPPFVQSRIGDIDMWLDASPGGAANIIAALNAVADVTAPAFICASDLPLICPGDINAFAEQCDNDCDFSAGFITQNAYETAFPLSPPSVWTPLRGAGNITLSGLYAVRPAMLLKNQARLTDVFQGRKDLLRLARLLGPRLVIAYLTHTLDVGIVTRRVETLLTCRAQTFNCDEAPSLACDMDTEDDYTYARTVHAARLVS